MFGLGRDHDAPELWLQPGGRDVLRSFGERLGQPDMFERTFTIREYEEGEPFTAAGFKVTPIRLPHYTLLTFGFRVSNERRVLAYSGDSAPSEKLSDLARDVDLFVCEATLERGELDGQPRGHLSVEEALRAFEASGARRLLLTHRPTELPVENGLELAYDGLQLDL
jgi:ribonuclease BN (tRNA processing enzyme)